MAATSYHNAFADGDDDQHDGIIVTNGIEQLVTSQVWTRTPDSVLSRIPLIQGPATFRVRYAFAAVASYGTPPANIELPDCSTNQPPVAAFNFSPSAPDEGAAVQFTDQSTAGDTPLASHTWTFGDGTTSADADPLHVFADQGPFTVKLTVTDSAGASVSTTKDVVIQNLPPTAAISDASVAAGQPVTLDLLIGDAGEVDRAALDYTLSSSNPGFPSVGGTVAAGPQSILVPALTEGTYPLSLTVTDKAGAATAPAAPASNRARRCLDVRCERQPGHRKQGLGPDHRQLTHPALWPAVCRRVRDADHRRPGARARHGQHWPVQPPGCDWLHADTARPFGAVPQHPGRRDDLWRIRSRG